MCSEPREKGVWTRPRGHAWFCARLGGGGGAEIDLFSDTRIWTVVAWKVNLILSLSHLLSRGHTPVHRHPLGTLLLKLQAFRFHAEPFQESALNGIQKAPCSVLDLPGTDPAAQPALPRALPAPKAAQGHGLSLSTPAELPASFLTFL